MIYKDPPKFGSMPRQAGFNPYSAISERDPATLSKSKLMATLMPKLKYIQDPESVARLMAIENETLDRNSVNKDTGAYGHLQILPSNMKAFYEAGKPGYREDFYKVDEKTGKVSANLDVLSQLNDNEYADLLAGYLNEPQFKKAKSFEDMYMAVFHPAAVGKPGDYVIGSANNTAEIVAEKNKNLVGDSGYVTRDSVLSHVNERLEAMGCGGSIKKAEKGLDLSKLAGTIGDISTIANPAFGAISAVATVLEDAQAKQRYLNGLPMQEDTNPFMQNGGDLVSGFKQYNAGSHDSGMDQPVDTMGRPNAQDPAALIQNKENSYNVPGRGQYVFSDKLTNMEGIAFNEAMKKLVKKYKNADNDPIEKAALNLAAKQLADENDMAREGDAENEFIKAYGGLLRAVDGIDLGQFNKFVAQNSLKDYVKKHHFGNRVSNPLAIETSIAKMVPLGFKAGDQLSVYKSDNPNVAAFSNYFGNKGVPSMSSNLSLQVPNLGMDPKDIGYGESLMQNSNSSSTVALPSSSSPSAANTVNPQSGWFDGMASNKVSQYGTVSEDGTFTPGKDYDNADPYAYMKNAVIGQGINTGLKSLQLIGGAEQVPFRENQYADKAMEAAFARRINADAIKDNMLGYRNAALQNARNTNSARTSYALQQNINDSSFSAMQNAVSDAERMNMMMDQRGAGLAAQLGYQDQVGRSQNDILNAQNRGAFQQAVSTIGKDIGKFGEFDAMLKHNTITSNETLKHLSDMSTNFGTMKDMMEFYKNLMNNGELVTSKEPVKDSKDGGQ